MDSDICLWRMDGVHTCEAKSISMRRALEGWPSESGHSHQLDWSDLPVAIELTEHHLKVGSKVFPVCDIRLSLGRWHLTALIHSTTGIRSTKPLTSLAERLECMLPAAEVHGRIRGTLRSAAMDGQVGIAATLLADQTVIEVDSPDPQMRSALHLAAGSGSPCVVATLLACGADVYRKDENGRTPIEYAIAGGHFDVVQQLVNSLPRGSLSRWSARDPNGRQVSLAWLATTLLDAPTGVEIAAWLIEHGGIDADAVDDRGWTALHWSAQHNHILVASCFLRAGADLHAETPEEGRTPLHIASRYGSTEVARLLLERGANPNRRDRTKARNTPLQLASLSATAVVLVEHGSRFDIRNNCDLRAARTSYIRATFNPTSSPAVNPDSSRSLSPLLPAAKWVPDSFSKTCMVCDASLSLLWFITHRRHHCRRCGMLVCDACSTKRYKFSRVCDPCFNAVRFADSERNLPTPISNSSSVETFTSPGSPSSSRPHASAVHEHSELVRAVADISEGDIPGRRNSEITTLPKISAHLLEGPGNAPLIPSANSSSTPAPTFDAGRVQEIIELSAKKDIVIQELLGQVEEQISTTAKLRGLLERVDTSSIERELILKKSEHSRLSSEIDKMKYQSVVASKDKVELLRMIETLRMRVSDLEYLLHYGDSSRCDVSTKGWFSEEEHSRVERWLFEDTEGFIDTLRIEERI